MIKKMKWKNLIQTKPYNVLSDSNDIIEEIDSLISTLLEHDTTNLKTLFEEVYSFFGNDSIWNELDIYISSYKENDKRIWYVLNQKLQEYTGFYKKLLTDNGISRKIVTQHNYQSNRTGKNKNTGLNSQTPQYTGLYSDIEEKISNVELEKAIANYASDISRDESDTQQNDSGASGTTVTGASWEETLKNVKLVYFNELVDFIANIPNLIYAYYSLDTLPTPALVRKYFDNVRATFEIENE